MSKQAEPILKDNSFSNKALLFENFLKQNDLVLSDYELLSLILSVCAPRLDNIKIAKILLDEFKELSNIINAPLVELTKLPSVSENTATALKVLSVCAKRSTSESLILNNKSVLDDWNLFLDYCRQDMAYKEIEEFKIFLLDEKLHCFAEKTISKGTINKTFVPPREIIKIAINLNAKNIILAHNHPSGDCKPSEEDILLTRDIYETAKNIDINVFDHIIVTKGEILSLRNSGYFNEFLPKTKSPKHKKRP